APAPAQDWPVPSRPGGPEVEVVDSAPVVSTGAPGAMDAAGVRRVWSELLGAVRKVSRSTEAMLTNATVQTVEGNAVVLAHTAAPLARRLGEARNTDAIAQAMSAVLGGTWHVRCVHADGAGAARPSAAEVPAPTRTFEPPRRVAVQEAPPEPDLPPPPPEPEDEEELMAQAARKPEPGDERSRQDPEEAMLKLLAEKLGARPVES
ncbi:MAG: DNA polymerase III subunit gamma/tau, partial [Actinomycetota bacterium]|nr:DNA polymerase III subunit gamma/tau [Actinomycetota bacterium]